MIFTGARVLKSLERGCCRTKQRNGAFEPGANDGDVAAVVTRRFFLLITRLLFFIDDDEADVFKRRKHSRARSHDDARFAAAHAPPFARAFVVGEPAVQYGNNAAE